MISIGTKGASEDQGNKRLMLLALYNLLRMPRNDKQATVLIFSLTSRLLLSFGKEICSSRVLHTACIPAYCSEPRFLLRRRVYIIKQGNRSKDDITHTRKLVQDSFLFSAAWSLSSNQSCGAYSKRSQVREVSGKECTSPEAQAATPTPLTDLCTAVDNVDYR